jgi:hypothetical protein
MWIICYFGYITKLTEKKHCPYFIIPSYVRNPYFDNALVLGLYVPRNALPPRPNNCKASLLLFLWYMPGMNFKRKKFKKFRLRFIMCPTATLEKLQGPYGGGVRWHTT